MSHATAFRALHAGPDILVLPNAWDAASAAMMADAGAKAVATSSAAVAWAHGYADGDLFPAPLLLTAISEMTRVLNVPLTADIEGGYTDDLVQLAQTIKAVVGSGAVGINLEDGRRDPALHARKIEAARTAADQAGVDLFINARTDVYLKGLMTGEAALAEVIDRARLYGQAGADGIFVPGPIDEALFVALAADIALPLNAMSRAGLPNAAALQRAGVRRLSSGGGLFATAYGALARATAAYLAEGDSGELAGLGEGLPNLNKRFG